MTLIQQFRKVLIVISLAFMVFTTSACAGNSQAAAPVVEQPRLGVSSPTGVERGTMLSGQEYGDRLVQTGKDLIKDAYVRDNNKIGVVITPRVRPNEVRSLAKSIVQSSHSNFPNRDLTVLVYAPDKELILTVHYDDKTQQIEYEAPKS